PPAAPVYCRRWLLAWVLSSPQTQHRRSRILVTTHLGAQKWGSASPGTRLQSSKPSDERQSAVGRYSLSATRGVYFSSEQPHSILRTQNALGSESRHLSDCDDSRVHDKQMILLLQTWRVLTVQHRMEHA